MGEYDQNSEDQSVDLLLLKKEVDALRIATLGQGTPWYKSMSIVLSVVALIFSFGTTFVSYKRTQSQDINDARVELRGLLQRLASLPREHYEITKKYEKIDPLALTSISSTFNQENALLARQAAGIAKKLSSEYVSATEYYAIGVALQNAFNVDGAKEIFTKAIDSSTDLSDRIGALRGRANLLFMIGQPGEGRVDYQRALNVFSDSDFRNTSHNQYTMKSTHVETELGWASSEANIGLIDVALQHVLVAEGHLSGLPASPGVNQLKNQIGQARASFERANGLTIPSGGLPLSRTSPHSDPR